MKTPHRRFQNKTPLQKMLEDGNNGVTAVLPSWIVPMPGT